MMSVASLHAAAATIPTPTPAQARYQDTDFVALIHFNTCRRKVDSQVRVNASPCACAPPSNP